MDENTVSHNWFEVISKKNMQSFSNLVIFTYKVKFLVNSFRIMMTSIFFITFDTKFNLISKMVDIFNIVLRMSSWKIYKCKLN